MSLEISKLEHVVCLAEGKIQARCPTCAAAGGDTKGEHLIIFPDGRFGCAANPGDEKHRKEIYEAAGDKASPSCASDKITIRSMNIHPPEVIMDLGKYSRFSRKPLARGKTAAPAPPIAQTVPRIAAQGPAAIAVSPQPTMSCAPIEKIARHEDAPPSATREQARTLLE